MNNTITIEVTKGKTREAGNQFLKNNVTIQEEIPRKNVYDIEQEIENLQETAEKMVAKAEANDLKKLQKG